MIRINNINIIPTIFPDKTSQVWKLSSKVFEHKTIQNVYWEFENEAEFMHLAQLKDLLDANDIKATLGIDYLPYARQDKEISNETTFALRTFAKLLNTLNFVEVSVIDAHSDVANLINNFRSCNMKEEVLSALEQTNSEICYPDEGAYIRYKEIYGNKAIIGKKIRDAKTGQITSYQVIGSDALNNANVLIVDDICDGGATFVLLAKELQKLGVSNIHLFVSHGLFTKGLQPLKDAGISRIFTKTGEIK